MKYDADEIHVVSIGYHNVKLRLIGRQAGILRIQRKLCIALVLFCVFRLSFWFFQVRCNEAGENSEVYAINIGSCPAK